MTGKANDLMDDECKQLVFDDSPPATPMQDVIPLQGFINLLAGTGKTKKAAKKKWARAVWGKHQPWGRWEGGDKKLANYKIHRVDLLINNITRADAARWLESIGETKDKLSEQVIYWLGDYLGQTGKLTPLHQKRLDLLSEVIGRLQRKDPNIDPKDMPGTRADLLKHCQWSHPLVFEMAESTFKSYIKGICSFRKGARQSSYYREKQSQLS